MQMPHLSHPYHVALDLGTAWTRAANPEGRRSAVRTERRGRPGVLAGAVADASTCTEILQDLFRTLRPPFSPFSRRLSVIAPVSPSATDEEKQALTGTLYRSGACSVILIPQPLAAAIGAGLDPGSDYAQMIVDVGDGFTEYSVIRSGKVEASEAVKVGCGTIRNAIAAHCRHHSARESAAILQWLEAHSLCQAGEGMGRAVPPAGLSQELRGALEGSLSFLAEGSLQLFRKLPDRVACEVIESGITLVGGGALLRELQLRMADRTGLAVRVPRNPLTAVIEGAAQVIPYAS